MGDKTGISWTDSTWNPIVGCSIVSPGCTNCYAMKQAARLQKMNPTGGSNSNYVNHYDGTTQPSKAGSVWTGKIALAPPRILNAPMHWRKPQRIFVNSMGDLFHEDTPDEWIDQVFAIMAVCSRHQFQVLTKRADRMRDYVSKWFERLAVMNPWVDHPAGRERFSGLVDWMVLPKVLPNVWLGTSAEDQTRANERIPLLLKTPAAVRFVSLEPLLGPIRLWWMDDDAGAPRGPAVVRSGGMTGSTPHEPSEGYDGSYVGIDWAIVGGESGHGPRPMDMEWVRSLRDQCAAAGVPFHFKQVGGVRPTSNGCELDGREWKDFPALAG